MDKVKALQEAVNKAKKNGRKFTIVVGAMVSAFVLIAGVLFLHSAITESKDVIELVGKFLNFVLYFGLGYLGVNGAIKFSKKDD